MSDYEWAQWKDCAFDALGCVLLWVLLYGCAACSSCKVIYAYDGGSTSRPYYKVRICDGKPAVVECDSPTRLPTAICR